MAATDLCDKLIPHFPEESVAAYLNVVPFVTCTDILGAITRGFATWEVNHPLIKFTDIREAPACADRSAVKEDACPWELYIGTANGEEYPGKVHSVLH